MIASEASGRRQPRAIRNRETVLDAARRVFLARGYAGATLGAIADEAGFSKGVVYSQFESKGDLFLCLVERRISERANESAAVADAHEGVHGVAALVLAALERDGSVERDWAQLMLEFRTYAARNPDLNRRYAEAHRRTVEGVAAALGTALEKGGVESPISHREMARLALAFASGVVLERSAAPDALTDAELIPAFLRLLGLDLPDATVDGH